VTEQTLTEQERLLLALGSEPMTATQIFDKVHITSARLFPMLAQLENDGKVISLWAGGPWPRKRVYCLHPGKVNGG
jgi:predicted Rossmann fold nucleotide-binding protein DprA/Smf involved in DNA uptake